MKIAVVPRVVGPADSVYAPIVGHTFVYYIAVKNPWASVTHLEIKLRNKNSLQNK